MRTDKVKANIWMNSQGDQEESLFETISHKRKEICTKWPVSSFLNVSSHSRLHIRVADECRFNCEWFGAMA